jgi:anti-sigma factor RsiW
MHPTNPSDLNQAPNDQRGSNERFELLSAYMDGEVTAEERRLVESWLANEPKVQQMHQRLLMLKHGFSAIETPEPVQPIAVTIDKVFERVERRSRFRVIVGGAVAAAAAVVATVVGINSVVNGPAQFAKNSPDRTIERVTPAPQEVPMTEGLLVSLDEPVVVVSKTASGGKSAQSHWADQQ